MQWHALWSCLHDQMEFACRTLGKKHSFACHVTAWSLEMQPLGFGQPRANPSPVVPHCNHAGCADCKWLSTPGWQGSFKCLFILFAGLATLWRGVKQALAVGSVTVVCHGGCRFGNSVEGSEAGLSIRVQTEGPGPVEAVVDCSLPGPARLQLLARQAGVYTLTLLSNAHEPLGQGPIQVSAVYTDDS